MDLTTPFDQFVSQIELAALPGRQGEIHRGLQTIAARDSLLITRRFSTMKRRISGYALDRLLPSHGYDVARFLSGSEGSLAVTLRASLNLVELPAATVLLVLGFTDSVAAADCVPIVLPHGPLTMESINATLVDRLPREVRAAAVAAGLPPGSAWLLVEMAGADDDDAIRAARAVIAAGSARHLLRRHRPGGPGSALAVPARQHRTGNPAQRRRRSLGRLGGRGRPPGAAGDVSARAGRAPGRARLVRRVIRPLR